MASTFKTGQKAKITSTQEIGIVRYIGPLHFVEGDWLGIELSSATGKNDGSVKGQRYFECTPNHGMFVKTAGAKPIASAPRPSSMAPPAAPAVKKPAGRLSMAPTTSGARPSSTQRASRQSLVAPRGPPARSETSESKETVNRAASQQSTDSKPAPTSAPVSEIRPKQTPSIEVKPQRNRELELEIEKLKAQNTALEEQVKTVTAEKDKLGSLIAKLESKTRSQSQEIAQLRHDLQEIQNDKESLDQTHKENQELEHNLERLALDKLSIEEKLEHNLNETKTLRDRNEELELEVDILRSEQQGIDEDLQEGENDPKLVPRLKRRIAKLEDGLFKAKDLFSAQEAQKKELQAEIDAMESLKEETELLREELRTSQSIVNSQNEMLDANEDQEEIIESLQAKDEANTETINNMKSELADRDILDTENNAIIAVQEDTIRDLTAEVETITNESEVLSRALVQRDDVIRDQEDTIVRFRSFVSDLQARNQEAERSTALSQQQQVEVEKNAQSIREILSKTQKQNNDSQLLQLQRELEIATRKQIETELGITKLYTRPEFHQVDQPKRTILSLCTVQHKTAALQRYIQSKANAAVRTFDDPNKLCLPNSANGLGYLNLLCSAMVNYLETAPFQLLKQFGEAQSEIADIEKAVGSWISGLINDGLGEADLEQQIRLNIKVLQSVVEQYKSTQNEEDSLTPGLKINYIQNSLDSIAIFHKYVHELFHGNFQLDHSADDLDKDQFSEHDRTLASNRNTLSALIRDSKNIGSQLTDITARGMMTNDTIQNALTNAMQSVDSTLNAYFQQAINFAKFVEFSKEHEQSMDFLNIRPVTGNVPYEKLTHLLADVRRVLTQIKDSMANPATLDEIPETSTISPWREHNDVLDTVQAEARNNSEENASLRAELAEKNTTIALNDKKMEELKVNVEVLTKKSSEASNYKIEVVEAGRARAAAESEIKRLNQKLLSIQQDFDRMAAEKENQPRSLLPVQAAPGPTPSRARDSLVAKRQSAALAETLRATRTKAVVVVDAWEVLDKPSTLEQRTAANLSAVMKKLEAEKKEKNGKKRSKAQSYREAQRAMEGFRRAMRR